MSLFFWLMAQYKISHACQHGLYLRFGRVQKTSVHEIAIGSVSFGPGHLGCIHRVGILKYDAIRLKRNMREMEDVRGTYSDIAQFQIGTYSYKSIQNDNSSSTERFLVPTSPRHYSQYILLLSDYVPIRRLNRPRVPIKSSCSPVISFHIQRHCPPHVIAHLSFGSWSSCATKRLLPSKCKPNCRCPSWFSRD
jgi:hypothetical protein